MDENLECRNRGANRTTRWKYLLLRSTSVLLMLLLTGVSVFLATKFANFTANGHVKYFPWPLLGDSLVPLLLFFFALLLRSRMCAVGAIITSFLNIFLRLSSIVIYHETFMPMDFDSVRMLLEHSDHYALRAVLGDFYYLWLIPLVGVVVFGVVYACMVVWRTSRNRGRRLPSGWSILFAVLLLLSGISNLTYALASKHTDIQDLYTGHLVRPLPFVTADYASKAFDSVVNAGSHPGLSAMSPESRRILGELQVFSPGNVRPDGELTAPPSVRFDKIIVIAVESLDLEYIGKVNPAMPQGITPNLDRLMEEYPSMTNYFAAAQPTSWALSAMLLSRVDYLRECQDQKKTSLFDIAAGQGIFCQYFSPISGIFGDNRRIYAQIFRPHSMFFLEDWNSRFGLSRSCTWGISDPELYDAVYQVLKSERRPRLLAVVSTMDSHPPYTASGITEEEKKQFPTPFLQALHTTDRHLGRFLTRIMADRELYNDRTLIVVTGDHTATHGENYLKRPDYDPNRIPLILITPDHRRVFAKLDTKKYASSIDLPPTLAEMIGGVTPDSFMGRTLFSAKNLAFSWVIGGVGLVRAPDFSLRINLGESQSDPQKQAFAEFFRYYYPR